VANHTIFGNKGQGIFGLKNKHMKTGSQVALIEDTETCNHNFVAGEIFTVVAPVWADNYGKQYTYIENTQGLRIVIGVDRVACLND